MRFRLIGFVVSAVGLCVVAMGAAGSAQASTVQPNIPYDCQVDAACLYSDANASGTVAPFYPLVSGYDRSVNLTDYNFNDVMSSWTNHTPTEYCWYVDANYQGGHHYMSPNHGTQNVTSGENDTASSIRPAPSPKKHGYYSNDDCY
jgi:hypothetical protein